MLGRIGSESLWIYLLPQKVSNIILLETNINLKKCSPESYQMKIREWFICIYYKSTRSKQWKQKYHLWKILCCQTFGLEAAIFYIFFGLLFGMSACYYVAEMENINYTQRMEFFSNNKQPREVQHVLKHAFLRLTYRISVRILFFMFFYVKVIGNILFKIDRFMCRNVIILILDFMG